jgi:hypothetical protein
MNRESLIVTGITFLILLGTFTAVSALTFGAMYIAESYEISPKTYGYVEWNRKIYPFSEGKIKEALLDGCITIREYNAIEKFIEAENAKNNKLNLIKEISSGTN